MFRWILTLATIGLIYWMYETGYLAKVQKTEWRAQSASPAPTLEPGGRLGGGLNPFVVDPGHGSAPQRPPMPNIPGR